MQFKENIEFFVIREEDRGFSVIIESPSITVCKLWVSVDTAKLIS